MNYKTRRACYNAADFIATIVLAAAVVSVPVAFLWALAREVMR